MTRTARVSMFLLAGLLTLLASAAERPKLRITSLADNATVSSPTIVLRGVGADPRGKLEVTVFSDRSYVQKGNTKINADGAWSFEPVYLSGEDPYNNHTIEVTIIRNGIRGETASVKGIRRTGPPR